MHSDAKLQNVENTHSDLENRTHEGNEELPDEDMHCDSDAERNSMDTRKEPRLGKYVRRDHPIE